MAKFLNAFFSFFFFLHKIKANTVREWWALRHSHYCQNSAQKGGVQDCLGHSQLPDVNLDEIQITGSASCLILLGSVRNQFSLKPGCHLNTIKATWNTDKNLSFFWMPFTTQQQACRKWSTHYCSFQLGSLSGYKIAWSKVKTPGTLLKVSSYQYIPSSVGKESACNAGDPSSILGWGRSPGQAIGYPLQYSWASLVAQMVKNLPQCERPGFDPWVGKIPWRRSWQPTPVFLPGEIAKDKGTWQAIIHGVKKSQTWLSK